MQSLPRGPIGYSIGKQILRSATSIGANYRAACRARSTADFIAKLKIVEEEADESAYWLEIMVEAGLVNADLLKPLLQEAEEILAIIVASINTTRGTGASKHRATKTGQTPGDVKSKI